MRQEAFLPVPHGFMGELKASQQKELSHIPIAEFVSYSAKQHLENDIGGDFDKVERRVCPAVEGAATVLAAKHIVAQVGLPLEKRNSG